MVKSVPDLLYLMENFKVDKETGFLYRLVGGKWRGPIQEHAKRRFVLIWGEKHPVARIVFAITNGEDPGELLVDHIDGNPANDKPSNLRAVPAYENAKNRRGSAYQKKLLDKG